MIRPFSLRDALIVRHLQTRGAAFDFKRCLLSTQNPTRSAVLGLVSGHYIGARTLVHTGIQGSDPVAFVQLLPREDGSSWDVVCIAPTLDEGAEVACLWQDMLSQAIITAAQQGVARIYARTPLYGDTTMVLRRSGFTVVGCEEVFASFATQAAVPMPAGLRPVADEDVWGLSELRRQVIPPLVYQAQWFAPEEVTSSAQAMGAAQGGYVWIDNGLIVAHMSLDSTARGHWIECTVRPERRGDLLPYLRYLLYVANGADHRPVYVSVPDYAVGLGWLLRTLGFESYGRQQVMVAHTVSRVTVSRPAVAHGLEGRVDIVAH
ncbi:MAG: hypothetical protein R6X16_07195 [Anaerolineae bacterium]